MSRLPYVVFLLTLLAIAGATAWHFQTFGTATAATPQVALAKKQIILASREPEVLPEVHPQNLAPEEKIKLVKRPPNQSASAQEVTSALAEQKAQNAAILSAATVLAGSSTPAKAASTSTPDVKLYVQIGLTVVFLPLCLVFILSSKFNTTQKNFAYTTIGTILGFWFTAGS